MSNNVISDEILRKLQLTELDILTVIDAFCKKHQIQYSLYAGTALGAVRHKGFIPWDDDIDIAMTRDQYNRFCALWRRYPVKGYTLSCLQYDDFCATCHAKVHKDNTLFLGEGEIESIGHHGIWVDIFPLDKVGNKENQKKVFQKATELILLSRANARNNKDSISKKICRGAISLIPSSVRKKRIRAILKWFINNHRNIQTNYKWVDLSAKYMFVYKYPKGIAEDVEKIEFEGQMFDIYHEYDQILSIYYGDYMMLPPENERVCTHNPIKLQF